MGTGTPALAAGLMGTRAPPGPLCPWCFSQLQDAPGGLGMAVSPQRAPSPDPVLSRGGGSPRRTGVAKSPASPASTPQAQGVVFKDLMEIGAHDSPREAAKAS